MSQEERACAPINSYEATIENLLDRFKTVNAMSEVPSDSVVQFSKDFDLMRKKFGEMMEQMKTYQSQIADLTGNVSTLQNQNVKLNSDITVIRAEHSEMMHTVYQVEQKNQELVKENLTLKDMIYKRKTDRPSRSPRTSLSPRDMPLQYRPRPASILQGPFSAALQKMSSEKGLELKPAPEEIKPYVHHEQPETPAAPIQRYSYVNTGDCYSGRYDQRKCSPLRSKSPMSDENQLSDWVLERMKRN